MTRIKPGKAYELFLAERAKLEAEVSASKEARWEAERRENVAEKALHALIRYEADPLAWANGDAAKRHTGLLDGFIRFTCEKCGASGSSADGRCVNCEESADGSARNLVNIYQSV